MESIPWHRNQGLRGSWLRSAFHHCVRFHHACLNIEVADLCVRLSCRAHDNVKFASSGGDRSIFLWDVASGNTIRRISGHIGKINTVEFNEDASVVASGELAILVSEL